jgi:hypothetical protein
MLKAIPTRVSLCLTSIALVVGCSGEGTEPGATTLTVESQQTTTTAPVAPQPVGTPGAPVTPTTPSPITPGTVNPPTTQTPTVTPPTASTPVTPPSTTTTTVNPSVPPPATTGDTGGTSSGEDVTSEPVDAPDLDMNGKPNAPLGTTSDVSQDYIRLGEIRILNNNWGSEDLGCTAPTSTMSVFLNQDGSFGWNFNRGDCAQPTDSSHPDFPQLEFGIHPFGIGSALVTSPEFSSTTLLPLQIKDITSASVKVDNLTINLQNQDSWNTTMEFWLSEGNPLEPNPKVYAELMTWWGWDQGRWPCDMNGDGMVDYGDRVSAGSMDYTLCHQDDTWADGWRYYQFRAGDGSDGNIKRDFNGTVDVKALLEYLVTKRGYSRDLWLTRMEVGSEIDDNTSGTVSMRGVTFEVNGESRSQVIGTPAQ